MAYLPLCHDSEGWGVFSTTRELDFTNCFEDIVLVSIPTIYLVLFGSIRYSILQKRESLPSIMTQNWLYFSKMTVLLLLLLTNMISLALEYSQAGFNVQWLTNLVNGTIVIVFLIHLHHLEYTRNRIQSAVLLFYWLFALIIDGIKLRSLLAIGNDSMPIVLYGVTFLLTMTIFILENIKRPKRQYISLDEDDSSMNPEENSNIFSRLTFAWMTPLIQKGYHAPLKQEDLWPLRYDDYSDVLSKQFESFWELEKKRKNPSLTRTLVYISGRRYVLAGILKLVKDILQYVQPLFLKYLILWVGSYLTDHPQPGYQGILISVGMFLSSLIQTICLHQYFHLCFSTSMKVRSVLVTAIYRKTLVLSNESRQESTVGEIVNHMAVDTTRIMDLFPNLHHVWSSPLQIFLSLYFLHQTMGPSIWAGVFILVLSIPINIVIGRVMRRYQKIQMGNKDKRIKLINEILNGIKVIKLYAWEKPFMDKIEYIRNKLELATLKKIGRMTAIQSFIWASVPFIVTVVTFGVYIYSSQPLTSDVVFVAISLFGMLQFPLAMGPDLISNIIEAHVSLRRIESYLTSNEMDPEAVQHEDYRKIPGWTLETPLVDINHGFFQWTPLSSTSSSILNDINFQAKKGELVAVVGRVGSGKSSLISALLGDIIKTQGTVTLRGSVAYASQQPWIMNDTVRRNIIFGHRFDPQFYEQVLDACCLHSDLLILSDGDQTEIGERGINLSGGQKARISLARALYARADIYLLDDPLSAVDAHVGKHIFDKVIGPHGLLKNKCRILVTHAITHLPLVDKIVMLRDGNIILNDTYNKLMDEQTELYSLLMEFSNHTTDSATDNMDGNNFDLDEAHISIGTELDQPSSSSSSSSNSNESSTRSLRRASLDETDWKNESTPTNTNSRGKSTTEATSTSNGNGIVAAGNLMTIEESSKGSVDRAVYKTYINTCSWWAVILAIILQATSQGLQVGANVWLKNWAASNDQNGTTQNMWMYLAIYTLIGWSASFFAMMQTLITRTYCAIRSAKLLHFRMLDAVVHSPMSFFDTTPLGRILNRFAKDQHTVDEILPRIFGTFFRVFPVVVAIMCVIGFSTPLFLVILIPLFWCYRTIQKYYLAASREIRRLDSVGKSPIYSHFQETINGVAVIRSFEQQQRFISQNEWKLDSNQKAYYPSMACNRWLALRLELLGSVVIFSAAILSVLGVLYQTSSTLESTSSSSLLTTNDWIVSLMKSILKVMGATAVDPGLVGLSVSYALNVTSSLTWVIGLYCRFEINIISVERIKEYAELPSEKYNGAEQPRILPSSDWPDKGQVIFQDFSTRYRPGLTLCLQDISFTINGGEKIGICGRTGGGKSSLTLSLFRILEAVQGSILIDGISIAKLGLFDLRSRLSIIPQDPVLFAGSVRDNLEPMGLLDDSALWKALDQSHLGNVIRSMEGQLDGLVLEGGENFSVGQRQLICLARALLRPTSILVLDEATAAIDVETDALIQETIRLHFKDCTILTIAHRVGTILDSDKIIVLQEGRIAEMDTPTALLKDTNSKFYALCKEANSLPS
ncbi:multi drug resistance-associated protein MRP [Halteromyces radiatus]|uniref:multi drug resistance-associated protein MRP n=1 Tax=Halteromyces radiatus TaxID=101107 RepID=UPI00221EFC18|nr:multi drug resistance-associated protein MRP [Halteromyces radiatus]KAI8088846.1 multi drug resistance-associated protein MRP [Halteromyces radiatus]